MSRITKVFVFIVNINGEEKIVMWPNRNGIDVPLVYTDEESIKEDNMRQAIQEMANHNKLYFELRTYTLIEDNTEMLYPTHKSYNA